MTTDLVPDATNDNVVFLFPNPVVTSLHIHFGTTVAKARITFYDIYSRIIFTSEEVTSDNKLDIDLTYFHDNIYSPD